MKKLLLLLGIFLLVVSFMSSGDKSTIDDLTKLNSFLNSDLDSVSSTPTNSKKDNNLLEAPRTAPVFVPFPNQAKPSRDSSTIKSKPRETSDTTTQLNTNHSTAPTPPTTTPEAQPNETFNCTSDMANVTEPCNKTLQTPDLTGCNNDSSTQASDSSSTNCSNTQ